MSKIDFTPGSYIYYEAEKYKIIKPINSETIRIQSLSDQDKIIDVSIFNVHSSRHPIKYNIEEYTDQEWEIANRRYKIIKDVIYKSRTKIEIQEIAQKNNKSIATIYNWIHMYEQTGKKGSLAPKKCGKKGKRLNSITNKIIEDILEVHYLSLQKTSFSKINRLIRQECKKLNIPPPHPNTIRNRIKSIDPKLSMKKREGYKKAHQEYHNFDGKFPEGNYPLDVIQLDHTPLDIMLVHPDTGSTVGRPTLTLAIDVYSRMIAGFYLTLKAPGYFNVSQCLYHVFMPKDKFLQKEKIEGEWSIFGIPRIIHVDNGKDLVGNDMQKVCDDLNIELMKRPVANPQFGAHVERVFRTINDEIHNLLGSTFKDTVQKGEYDSIKKATFSLAYLQRWLTQFIVNIYHKNVHRGLNKSPEDRYYQGIFGDDENPGTGILPSRVEDEEQIRILLLPTFYRTVQRDGITLDGITYYDDVLRIWINSRDKNNKKRKFKIKRDPLNINKIYFYDPEIKEYFEIFYRKMQAPEMTLWDMNDAKRYLKNKNISRYTEDDIFAAYELLEQIEKETEKVTKKNKLRKNKSIKMRDIKKENIEKKPQDNATHIDELFNNVETFQIHKKTPKDTN